MPGRIRFWAANWLPRSVAVAEVLAVVGLLARLNCIWGDDIVVPDLAG